MNRDERFALIEREDSSSPSERVVSLLWQADLLSVTPSRLYYAPHCLAAHDPLLFKFFYR